MSLDIGNIKEASTIDYPGEMVSVIFLCHCSFKCPFCQNWSLVLAQDCYNMSIEQIMKQLIKYRKYITGICFTGGEPTVQIKGLTELMKATHKQGLLNKLDTNGYYPNRIKNLLSLNLIDYAAIDIKAPLIPKKYGEMIGMPKIGKDAVNNVMKTLRLFKKFSISYETRTTVIPTHNDTKQEIEQISNQLRALKVSCYILQQFRASGGTLDENFSKLPATDYELLTSLAKTAKKVIPDVRIRTIDAGEEKI